MNNVLGTFEAKTHFNKIIQKVNDGEEFLITRRGQPVAKIVPIESINDSTVKSAISKIKSLSKEIGFKDFDWEELKAYRDAGKK